MGVNEKRVCCTKNSILSEIPYANVDIIRVHGQFNNMPNSDLTTKKYLDKLHILYLSFRSVLLKYRTKIKPR